MWDPSSSSAAIIGAVAQLMYNHAQCSWQVLAHATVYTCGALSGLTYAGQPCRVRPVGFVCACDTNSSIPRNACVERMQSALLPGSASTCACHRARLPQDTQLLKRRVTKLAATTEPQSSGAADEGSVVGDWRAFRASLVAKESCEFITTLQWLLWSACLHRRDQCVVQCCKQNL